MSYTSRVVDPSPRPDTPSPGPLHALELAQVARRHYLDGKSKVEIANERGISRFRVARLLEEALSSGLVTIHIDVAPHLDLSLSDELTSRYQLQRAVVATTHRMTRSEERSTVVTLAAAMFAELLDANDIVGIGGGRTLYDVMDALSELPPCTSVQLIGGVPDVGLWANSVDLTRLFAERTGGPMHTYLLPFLVNDPDVADRLRESEQFSEARNAFQSLSMVITSIGSWSPPPRSGLHDLLSEHDQRALRRRGVVADVLGVLVDIDGAVVANEHTARSIGISLPELRRVPTVVAVVSGSKKADAVRAVLRSQLVTTIVCDSATARLLLSG